MTTRPQAKSCANQNQTGKASFVWAEPDPIDTIERSRSARLRAVEEFDGVGVEREALEVLDKVVGEDLV